MEQRQNSRSQGGRGNSRGGDSGQGRGGSGGRGRGTEARAHTAGKEPPTAYEVKQGGRRLINGAIYLWNKDEEKWNLDPSRQLTKLDKNGQPIQRRGKKGHTNGNGNRNDQDNGNNNNNGTQANLSHNGNGNHNHDQIDKQALFDMCMKNFAESMQPLFLDNK